jgi:polysaccharide biosynthesis transport protein
MSRSYPATDGFEGLANRLAVTGLRSVGFTSALPGEGVSTIALGTALSLASAEEETVLLVDSNWMQPALTEDARMESAAGLASYLTGRVDLSSAVHPTARPFLSFLPVGDRAGARLTVRALAALLAKDALAFDRIVVDLPPVLAGEQFVHPWMSLLDGVFLVVKESATPLPLVRDALDRMGPATPEIVLNRATRPSLVVARAPLAARA